MVHGDACTVSFLLFPALTRSFPLSFPLSFLLSFPLFPALFPALIPALSCSFPLFPALHVLSCSFPLFPAISHTPLAHSLIFLQGQKSVANLFDGVGGSGVCRLCVFLKRVCRKYVITYSTLLRMVTQWKNSEETLWETCNKIVICLSTKFLPKNVWIFYLEKNPKIEEYIWQNKSFHSWLFKYDLLNILSIFEK